MVFYGVGQVWDSTKNQITIRFKDGIYETHKLEEIQLLQKLNYKFVEYPYLNEKEELLEKELNKRIKEKNKSKKLKS